MKQNTITFLLISILSLSACGPSPEDARKELGQLNIPYRENSFIESAANGDMMTVKLFLAAGMNVNSENGMALVYAAREGRIEVVKTLLSAGADINKGGSLIAALQANQFEIVKLLLDRGADVNIENGISLRIAADSGRADVVKLLLDKGADINVESVLIISAQKGNIELAKVLIDHGASVNIQYGEPLRIAVRDNDYNLAEFLLNNGADPNITNSNEVPVLLTLADNGQTGLINLLLNKGANVNITDGNNTTALMVAVGSGHIDTAKALLDKGADINARQVFDGKQPVFRSNSYSIHGETALLRAISRNDPEMLKFVLNRIADINANGGEALLYAVNQAVSHSSPDYSNMVKILIDNNANINVKNRNGETLLHMATSYDRSHATNCERQDKYRDPVCRVIDLLKDAGGIELEKLVPQHSKLPNPLGLKENLPPEFEAGVVRETEQVQQQEGKVQTEDQQTIQESTVPKISAKPPSYDCSQAKTDVEITVCNDHELSSMDAEMADLYRSHKQGLPSDIAKKLIDTQKSWLSTRKRCGANIGCLHVRYQERIMWLKKYEPYD